MSSDNDLIRRGDALVKARPFCESQGDEWDRGYNTAISHYQLALLALTAAPAAREEAARWFIANDGKTGMDLSRVIYWYDITENGKRCVKVFTDNGSEEPFVSYREDDADAVMLALTAAPGSPTCRVCGWPFVSPHYPPCTGHEVPWKDEDALLKRAEAAEAERDRLAGAVKDIIDGMAIGHDYRYELTAALAGEK